MNKNPFTKSLTKGNGVYLGRDNEQEELLDNYLNDLDSVWATFVTGVRGSGKTMFIKNIKKNLEDNPEWCVVWLNNNPNIFSHAVNKLNKQLRGSNLTKLKSLTFGPISGEVERVKDMALELQDAMEYARDLDINVLFIIDEIKNTPAAIDLISTIASLYHDDYPIAMLTAGLPENVEGITSTDIVSSLSRTNRIELKSLTDLSEFTDYYENVLRVTYDVAEHAAHLTKGYGFAFQLLGYLMFEKQIKSESDIDKCLKQYKKELYSKVYKLILNKLSKEDVKLLNYIAFDGNTTSGAIENLEWSKEKVNLYRRRLLDSMLITQPARGIMELALPELDSALNNWLQ